MYVTVGSGVATSGLAWLVGLCFLAALILAFFILVFFILVFFILVFFVLVFFALRFLAMELPLHLFEPSQITRFALHGECGMRLHWRVQGPGRKASQAPGPRARHDQAWRWRIGGHLDSL